MGNIFVEIMSKIPEHFLEVGIKKAVTKYYGCRLAVVLYFTVQSLFGFYLAIFAPGVKEASLRLFFFLLGLIGLLLTIFLFSRINKVPTAQNDDKERDSIDERYT